MVTHNRLLFWIYWRIDLRLPFFSGLPNSRSGYAVRVGVASVAKTSRGIVDIYMLNRLSVIRLEILTAQFFGFIYSVMDLIRA
jgi:hypothetical protein